MLDLTERLIKVNEASELSLLMEVLSKREFTELFKDLQFGLELEVELSDYDDLWAKLGEFEEEGVIWQKEEDIVIDSVDKFIKYKYLNTLFSVSLWQLLKEDPKYTRIEIGRDYDEGIVYFAVFKGGFASLFKKHLVEFMDKGKPIMNDSGWPQLYRYLSYINAEKLIPDNLEALLKVYFDKNIVSLGKNPAWFIVAMKKVIEQVFPNLNDKQKEQARKFSKAYALKEYGKDLAQEALDKFDIEPPVYEVFTQQGDYPEQIAYRNRDYDDYEDDYEDEDEEVLGVVKTMETLMPLKNLDKLLRNFEDQKFAKTLIEFVKFLQSNKASVGDYHSSSDYTKWRVEMDSSLDPDIGMEVISPIMKYDALLKELPKVAKWLYDLGFRGTDKVTGLHINIGYDKASGKSLDADVFKTLVNTLKAQGLSDLTIAAMLTHKETYGLYFASELTKDVDPHRASEIYSQSFDQMFAKIINPKFVQQTFIDRFFESMAKVLKGMNLLKKGGITYQIEIPVEPFLKKSTLFSDTLQDRAESFVDSIAEGTHRAVMSARSDRIEVRALGGKEGFNKVTTEKGLGEVIRLAVTTLAPALGKPMKKKDIFRALTSMVEKTIVNGFNKRILDAQNEPTKDMLKYADYNSSLMKTLFIENDFRGFTLNKGGRDFKVKIVK